MGRTRTVRSCWSPTGSGDDGHDGWVAASGAGIDERAGADGAFTIGLGRLLRGVDGERSAAELAGAVTTASAELARLLPPFAVAHRRAAGEAIHVAVDWLGFFQLYVWQGTGVAAVSTSARALAALAGGGFDDTALGVQAMIGWQPGDATIFAGVRAVPAATVVTLQHGVLRTEQYVAPLSFARSNAPAPALADAVDEMAAILRGALERSVVDHPDALLQLTGGHDSRILLGAVAPARPSRPPRPHPGRRLQPRRLDRRRPVPALRDGAPGAPRRRAGLAVAGRRAPARPRLLAGPRVPGESAGVGAAAARRARHRPGPPPVRARRRGGARFLLRRPAARRQHVAEPRHAPRPVAAVQQRGGRGRGARPDVPRRGAVHHDGPADDAVRAPGTGCVPPTSSTSTSGCADGAVPTGRSPPCAASR